MDINNIQTFLKVTSTENFTMAAAELGYAQSTISNQIRNLEEDLGYPLFDRMGKKIYLTSLGTEFIPIASQIIQQYSRAKNLCKNQEDIHGTLHLGLLESLILTMTDQIVPAFKNKYCNVDLKITVRDTADLLDMLLQNRVDIAFISGRLESYPNLTNYYSKQEEMIFTCSSSNPLCLKEKVSLEEILQYQIITTEKSGVCFTLLRELANTRGLSLNRVVEINNTSAICELVEKSDDISFLPLYSVMRKVAHNKLKILNVDIPQQKYYIKVVCHSSKWANPYMEGMMEIIRDCIG